MAFRHGIYTVENATALIAPAQVNSGIIFAVGTAPLHLAQSPAEINKPVLAYKYSEAVKALGFSLDFEKYSLCEVMQNNFSLYSIAPTIFVNVLDAAKHYELVEMEIADAESATLKFDGAIDASSFKLTSGEYEPPTKLTLDTDYEIEEIEYDDTDTDNVIEAATHLKILNGDAAVDNKVVVTYRRMATALGGAAISSELTLTQTTFDLPTDTILASVVVETGGVDTLVDLIEGADFSVEYDGESAIVTLLDDSNIVDDTIKLSYHRIDPSKVTAADIIGGIDAATGKATGLELVDSVFPMYNLVVGTLIAPKYSEDATVAAALTAKAKLVSGMFPAMAVVDLSTEDAKTYQQAVEVKSRKNLNDAHCIVCWPQVSAGGVKYHLSTQIAALMAQVDAGNDDLPYQSPSNQSLQMDSAVLADGTEIYLQQEQANLLNMNGVVTAFAFNGWRAWGNQTSNGANGDVKDCFIPVRRMLNYLRSEFAVSFLSRLDFPITRRQIDSILNSANLFLSGLTSRGALLGATISLDDDLTTADLLNGELRFKLFWASPTPAQSFTVTFEYNPDYLSALMG